MLVAGVVGSLLAALPATWRLLQAGAPASALIPLAASASLVVVPITSWLRQTRVDERRGADLAVAAGAALSALPLALFGGVLKSTTHHRPLGGATFAVVALGVLALCLFLSLRVLRSEGSAAVNSAWQKLFLLGCGLSLLATLVLAGGGAWPSMVDFLTLSLAALGAGLLKTPRWLARVGAGPAIAGWLTLIVCGVLLARSPQLSRSLPTEAPVSFAALSWLGAGS